MYVCVCKSVSDGDIQAEIDNGAETLRDLQIRLGVATQCGSCANCARSMLKPQKTSKKIKTFRLQPLPTTR